MEYSNQFFEAINVNHKDRKQIQIASTLTNIPVTRLNYFNNKNIIPTGNDLTRIKESFGVTEVELMLKMGQLNRQTIELIQAHSDKILQIIPNSNVEIKKVLPAPIFSTKLGKLYQGDCLEILKNIECDSVDLIFSDPPFNLNKLYPSQMDDNLKAEEYLRWSEKWMQECIRILKPGGAFFTWNLPNWNIDAASFLKSRLSFKHWIAVDIKYSMPIKNKLYPSHYSLLYYTKGDKPNYFNADRLPTQTCPKCYDNLKDYGGYKNKMNPLGISLTDVWTDITPVRHKKYKKREGANELPIRLLDRIIEMASKEGDTILDPFGGSGTTYSIAELKNRKWIGVEIGPCDDITNRFEDLTEEAEQLSIIRSNTNALFPKKIEQERTKRGLWTSKSFN
jgi:site-specific DNA-methyltransferase (adenine-specific)